MYNLLLTLRLRGKMETEAPKKKKRPVGRPRKYPEGCKAHYAAEKLKKNGPPEIRPDGKPKHFRIRRTQAEIRRDKKNKYKARNNHYEDTSEFQKLLAGTKKQKNKLPLFKMSQYITINRIENAIKAIKTSPHGLIVHEYFIKAFGNLEVSIIFSFLLYMEHNLGVNEYPDSWFCIIYRHVAKYTGVKIKRVPLSIHQLRNAGLLDTKREGIPAKVHYRINHVALMELLYDANHPRDYKGQSVLVERVTKKGTK